MGLNCEGHLRVIGYSTVRAIWLGCVEMMLYEQSNGDSDAEQFDTVGSSI